MGNNLGNVLLVDDERHVLNSLCRALAGEPYRVFTASSAKEALEVLAQEEIALLITDHRMPGMTGLDLLRQLQHLYPDTLTILLTGYADLDLALDIINRTSVFRLLLKPWKEEELKSAIVAALRLRRVLDETGASGEKPELATMTLKALERAFPGIANVQEDREGHIFIDTLLTEEEIRDLLKDGS